MLHKIKEVLEHSQTNKISLGGVNSLKVKVQQNPANCNSKGKPKNGSSWLGFELTDDK